MASEEKAAEREERVRKGWRSASLLQKLQERRKGAQKYFLLDGPPYANYEPHVGHIRNTVYKDLYIRWNFMKGKDVLFQPGFDTHGLPIENMVEKKLALSSKKDIQRLGIAAFMKTCRESAALNKDLWMHVYEMLGSWYSWKEPYLTYENSYIESVWWSFKRLWEKGMAYEGQKPVFWCPSCETALAGYEATDSYKNVTDPAIYVKFKLKGTDASLLVYTTTPWTLPANCAVAVAGDEAYVKAKTKDHGTLILAKERLAVLDELGIKYDVVDELAGKTLEGQRYEPLLDVPSQKALSKDPHALRVYLSIPILKERVASKVAAKKGLATGDVYEDFVTVTEGTGLVHCAPGHGKTDNEIGKHYGIPAVSPLDDQCKFTAEAGRYAGTFVKEADHAIAEDLHKNGRLLHYGTITHSYPLCWRCKSPLIFRMSDQWFLKVDAVKEKMLEANEKVNWQPPFAQERFGSWVANADDWNFSRQRYWGVPIPIWKGEKETLVVGSAEELRKYAIGKVPEDFDLHAASEVKLKGPKTGETLARVSDIFDVWYDSGAAPYASLGYPFKNKELFESHYPVDRINESQDQIRGWFYSLMFCSMAVFGKAPYKTVSMPGWVLDEKGEKMSKSQGNMVLAKDALEELGADALRFYYCWDVSPASTQKFNLETIKTDVRRFFTIWRNLTALVHGNGVHFSAKSVACTEAEDKWLLSRLHTSIKEVHRAVESFELHIAGRALQEFIVEDLSRTYVQLVRERLDEDDTPMRLVGHCLWAISKLAAAITPFASEETYAALKELVEEEALESVHLELLPQPSTKHIDEQLEESMALAADVIAGILSARDKLQTGVRWPLAEAVVDTPDAKTAVAVKKLEGLVKRQTNVRTLTLKRFTGITYEGKLNFQALGKTYGQKTGDAAEAFAKHKAAVIEGVSGPEGKATAGGFEFLPEHVNLEKKVPDTHALGEFKRGSAYLAKKVSRELELEGYARELTRRLQQLRKESGLEKKDAIEASVKVAIADELAAFAGDIKKRVGAKSLMLAKDAAMLDKHAEAKIKGLAVTVSLRKC